MYIPISTYHEAFWELTGFRFHGNFEVKRVARESIPRMGDPSGSSRVSSQKQNREGVVGAQSGQYRATVVERAREVIRPGPGCDKIGVRFVRMDGELYGGFRKD